MTEEQKQRRREYMIQWRKENHDHIIAYAKTRYAADPERFRRETREYVINNPDKVKATNSRCEQKRRGTRKEYNRVWRDANRKHCNEWRSQRYKKHKKEELKSNSVYCKENADRVNYNSARRYAKNPQRFIDRVSRWRSANSEKVKLIVKACHVRRKRANGRSTFEQIKARIDFYGGCCAYCGKEYEHLDHVIAISLGGSAWPANIRPACRSCNLRKHAKNWRVWLKVTDKRPADPLLEERSKL